jgi:hypothetical protein
MNKGLQISIENDASEIINQVYELHTKHMKYLGTPPHSKKFFIQLFKNKNFSVITRLENKITSFHVFMMFKNEIRWVIGNFDMKYKNRLINTYVLWHIIKNNLNSDKIFDLGGSRYNSGNYFYKIGWLGKNFANGQLEELRHYHIFLGKKDILDVRNKKYEVASTLWRSYMPKLLTDKLGPLIRKEMGL